MIDWKEVIVTLVETVGYDNTDKFFAEQTPVTQFSEQLKQIPQEMQAQAQKQVQMQAMRDNARAELEAQGVNQVMGVM